MSAKVNVVFLHIILLQPCKSSPRTNMDENLPRLRMQLDGNPDPNQWNETQ
jgi:hypothetical protein